MYMIMHWFYNKSQTTINMCGLNFHSNSVDMYNFENNTLFILHSSDYLLIYKYFVHVREHFNTALILNIQSNS